MSTMLVRSVLIVGVALALVAISPVLSRPAPNDESNSDSKGANADSVPDAALTSEKRTTLEEEGAGEATDPGLAKKPAKRSQGVLAGPPSTAESVSLSPQIPDPDKKGSAIQGLLLNILHPKPIVDTIREEDKYGNTGDKFATIGRGVVAGAQGVSQVLLKVLDFPFEAVKKVSRSATEALNNLGSKLIGL